MERPEIRLVPLEVEDLRILRDSLWESMHLSHIPHDELERMQDLRKFFAEEIIDAH